MNDASPADRRKGITFPERLTECPYLGPHGREVGDRGRAEDSRRGWDLPHLLFREIEARDSDSARRCEENPEDPPSTRSRWPESGSRRCGMKKSKLTITRDARQLAEALGLTPAYAVEIEVRSTLNDKIVEIVGATRAHSCAGCQTVRDLAHADYGHYESEHAGRFDRSTAAHSGAAGLSREDQFFESGLGSRSMSRACRPARRWRSAGRYRNPRPCIEPSTLPLRREQPEGSRASLPWINCNGRWPSVAGRPTHYSARRSRGVDPRERLASKR